MKVILGAGGLGRTVLGILESNRERNIVLLDDNLEGEVNGYKIIGKVKDLKKIENREVLIAFGSTYMLVREKLSKELEKEKFFNAIHKNCYIDRTAKIGKGNILSSNCVLNPNSEIGNHNVFCVHCTIDHDCKLGNNIYFGPGVNLGGAVEISDNVFIGTNATILPGKKIGKNSLIGAGCVITKDVPENVTVVGVPGRIIKKEGVK